MFADRKSYSRSHPMRRAMLPAARSRPTSSRVTGGGKGEGEEGGEGGSQSESQLSRTCVRGVIASRVKCNASRGLLPHPVISRGTFLASCRLLITFLTATQPRISSRKFDRDGVKILPGAMSAPHPTCQSGKPRVPSFQARANSEEPALCYSMLVFSEDENIGGGDGRFFFVRC